MVEVFVSGVMLGVETPVVLLVLPVALVVVAWLVLPGRPDAPVDRRSRLVLFALRALVVTSHDRTADGRCRPVMRVDSNYLATEPQVYARTGRGTVRGIKYGRH